MKETMTVPSWRDQKQTNLVEMESDWRQLDQTELLAGAHVVPRQIELAKQEKQAEVSRLRAELAVASFVDRFYSLADVDVDDIVASHLVFGTWTNPLLTRDIFSRFVRQEWEFAARSDTRVLWGLPTSVGDPTAQDWWVDLEAVRLLNGREQAWQRYRFHVISDRVDGWVSLDEAGAVAA